MDATLPFSDLEAALGWPGTGALGRLLRCSSASVHRYRRWGLDVERADELAVRAGFHPAEVWGAAWSALPDEDDVAAQVDRLVASLKADPAA